MSKKCLGCGIELQDVDSSKDGYVDDLNKDICRRCFLIKNYGKYTNTYKNNTQYMKIFNKINNDDLVIYLSSILTLNLDYINKFKKILLVITKRDIMPKSIKDDKIKKYVLDRYKNILDIEIISSYKNYNLDNLYDKIKKYGNNRKIYFVGATNSGKSTLINTLLRDYSDSSIDITTSLYPSTTLDIIPIKFNDLELYDTPGILIDNSIINYIDSKLLKKVNNKKEIKTRTYQVSGKGSLLFEDMIRIDYETVESSMTFYASNNISLRRNSLSNDKLLDGYKYEFNDIKNNDIVIEDLGFVKITNSVNIKIYSKYDICLSKRDNLI